MSKKPTAKKPAPKLQLSVEPVELLPTVTRDACRLWVFRPGDPNSIGSLAVIIRTVFDPGASDDDRKAIEGVGDFIGALLREKFKAKGASDAK